MSGWKRQWLVVSCKNSTSLTTAFLSTFSSAFNTFEWHQRIKKLHDLSLSSSSRLYLPGCDRLHIGCTPHVSLLPSTFSTCVSMHLSLSFWSHSCIFFIILTFVFLPLSYLCSGSLDSVSTSFQSNSLFTCLTLLSLLLSPSLFSNFTPSFSTLCKSPLIHS